MPDLYDVGGMINGRGGRPGLISLAMALASTSLPSPKEYSGYLFADITTDSAGAPFDPTKNHGLCAYPKDYPTSGQKTFVISQGGIVFWKDTKGVPITAWPDPSRDGWTAQAN
jgi:hypothetical protein